MLLGFHNDLRQTLLSRRAKALADGEAKLAAFYDRLAALSSKGPDPAKAVALLESVALEHSNRSELLYTRAMLYERSRNFEQMELLLRSLIAKEPKHAHALNALGYSFADRNERLPEAKVLIEQALRLQPNDPHILDSMGWVYFRKGMPKDALPFLYSAYERQPDAEISAHLGEVLWQLSRADEALAVFRLGLSHDPQNAVLRETLARLGIARKAVLSDPLTEALDPSGSP
jgi:Flp pilus assembly protein TadD